MKIDIALTLRAHHSASLSLLQIKNHLDKDLDSRSLHDLMKKAMEYIVQLNPMLMKGNEENDEEIFKAQLIQDAVGGFIGDVRMIKASIESTKNKKNIGVLE